VPGAVRTYALEAQLVLAGLDTEALSRAGVRIEVVDHDDLTSFVKSKVTVDEGERVVTLHQFVAERTAGTGRPTQVRLKVKSGDALNRHFPLTDGPPLAAEPDAAGSDLIAAWLAEAVAASSAPDATATVARFVIDGDSMAETGQDWVQPFATARIEDDAVHLQSRSLFVLQSFPLPPGFTPPPGILGVHYVAVPAPELIADLVDGVAAL